MSVDDGEVEEKKPKRRVRSPVHDQISRSQKEKAKGGLTNERVAELLDIVASNPDDVVRKLAKAEGFPHHVIELFLKRLRVNHQGLKEAVQTLGHQQLIYKIDEKIALGLKYMDDMAFAGLNAMQIAITLGILIEKKQLLQNKPTAILSFEERGHLGALLPAYVREAQRRGMFVDLTATEVFESPKPLVIAPDVVQEEAVNHTARRMRNLPEAEG